MDPESNNPLEESVLIKDPPLWFQKIKAGLRFMPDTWLQELAWQVMEECCCRGLPKPLESINFTIAVDEKNGS
jgi:hypothetical protein